MCGLLGVQADFPLPDMVLHRIQMHGIKIGSFVQLKKLVKLLEKTPVNCFCFVSVYLPAHISSNHLGLYEPFSVLN